MRNFSYSFQRILEIKEKEKESAQLQVAQALQKKEKAEVKLSEVSLELKLEEERIFEQQKEGVSITELRVRENYVNQLRDKMVQEQEVLHLANKNVVQKQTLLQNKVIEEKKWCLHKEKLELEFREEFKKKEQMHLDELSSQRYYHQLNTRE